MKLSLSSTTKFGKWGNSSDLGFRGTYGHQDDIIRANHPSTTPNTRFIISRPRRLRYGTHFLNQIQRPFIDDYLQSDCWLNHLIMGIC